MNFSELWSSNQTGMFIFVFIGCVLWLHCLIVIHGWHNSIKYSFIMFFPWYIYIYPLLISYVYIIIYIHMYCKFQNYSSAMFLPLCIYVYIYICVYIYIYVCVYAQKCISIIQVYNVYLKPKRTQFMFICFSYSHHCKYCM